MNATQINTRNPYFLDNVSQSKLVTNNANNRIAKNKLEPIHFSLKQTIGVGYLPQPLTNLGVPPTNISQLFANTQNNDTSEIFSQGWDHNAVFLAIDLLPIIEAQTKAIKTMVNFSNNMLTFIDNLSKVLRDYATWLTNDLDKKYQDNIHKMHKATHKGGVLGALFGALEIFAALICVALAAVATVVSGGAATPLLVLACAGFALALADGCMKIDASKHMLENPDDAAKYEAQVQFGMYKALGNNATKVQIAVALIMLLMTLGTSAASSTTQVALEGITTAINVASTSTSLAGTAISVALPEILITITTLLNVLTMVSGMVAQLADKKPSKNAAGYEQMASSGLFALLLYTLYHESGAEKEMKAKYGDTADLLFQTIYILGANFAINIALQKGMSERNLRLSTQGFELSTFMTSLSQIIQGMQAQMIINQAGTSAQNIITTIKQNIMDLTQVDMQLDETKSNMDINLIKTLQQITQKLANSLTDKSTDMSKMVENFMATLNNMLSNYMANATK